MTAFIAHASRAAVLAGVLLTGACGLIGGGGGGSSPAAGPPPATPMPPPVRLYSDNAGGIRDSVRVVLRDRVALERQWQQATSPQSSPPATPTIDFEREMVILVATGRKTPEEEIHVDSLLVRREMNSQGENEETLTIVVRTVVGCGRFRTDAFPLTIVRARRFDGPVKWDDRTQQKNCSPEAAGS